MPSSRPHLQALDELMHHSEQLRALPQGGSVADQDPLTVHDAAALYLLQIVFSQRHPCAYLQPALLSAPFHSRQSKSQVANSFRTVISTGCEQETDVWQIGRLKP